MKLYRTEKQIAGFTGIDGKLFEAGEGFECDEPLGRQLIGWGWATESAPKPARKKKETPKKDFEGLGHDGSK